MALKAQDRFIWDATVTLEALGAATVALWSWDPGADRLRLTGAARRLGLSPLAPECSSAAVRALAMPQDRALVEEILKVQAPGGEISARVRMRGGDACIWRGEWLEDGVRAAGVIVPETSFASSDQDALTGLLDRRSFVSRAREQLQAAGGYSLVVADLDRLRRLNEALGHERADLVLAALGSRLATAFPPHALLARVGEDEFAVLAPGDIAEPSELMRRAMEQPLRVAGFDIFPTLSIGAVEAQGGVDAPDAAELLRRAEIAVESAKSAGRGGAAEYGRALESDGLSRLALESDLRGAIGRGEIVPFFQPVVRLDTGAIAGFEALARWRHPRRGVMTPEEFLPLCEEMGLLVELGTHMMGASARQLSAWRAAHRAAGEISVSVNLSTGEIHRDDLVSDVAALLKETGLPRGMLKLEITESDIMREPEAAAVILHQLRDAGAGLALDDFGTGFSSLQYLTRLPFDTLKIDRYFVRTMATNEGSDKIVRSVINLGRDLALEVVAEGVENAPMARRLLELGCHYGQGYGYAPALSSTEAEVYLNESYVDGTAPVKARG
ncbi:MAG TPA: bifunctional diguanylate cyclase/phosphodiesterase [Caulobacteraceae bacterium]|nr:bifunctional diguanylate cyclase/phosphodiesterase [Caulobacteraceae bacterium]